MSLYYCESENTKAIFHIVKKGNKWHAYDVFENKNGEVTNVLIGVGSSEKSLIEIMTSIFDRTVDMSRAREE